MLQEARGSLILVLWGAFLVLLGPLRPNRVKRIFRMGFARLPLPVTGWRPSADGFAREIQRFLGQLLRNRVSDGF